MAERRHRNALQPGYLLHWYRVQKILGQGGFGITYLAEDTNLHKQVAIKEYLPVELAIREGDHSVHPVSEDHDGRFKWGLDRFVTEAQTLARFQHPNIVRVLTVFTANNTAYMVMEYEQGEGLDLMLMGRPRLSETECMDLLMPILDGLEQVHAAGFIHRDIKPPNIFIRESGSPVLLDFGSARQSLGQETRTLTTLVSPGYAPFEQYVCKSDKQGPWTDIYGLAATLHRIVAGKPPADAMDRSESLLQVSKDTYSSLAERARGGYSARFLAGIDHALAFKPEDRPQSVSAWRSELTAGAAHAAARAEAGTTLFDATQVLTPAPRPQPAGAGPAVAAAAPLPKLPGSRPLRLLLTAAGIAVAVGLLHQLHSDNSVHAAVAPLPGVHASPVHSAAAHAASAAAPPAPAQSVQPAATAPADTSAPAQSAQESVTAPALGSAASEEVSKAQESERLKRAHATPQRDSGNLGGRRQVRAMLERLGGQARRAVQAGDYDRAESYLHAALKLAPENRRLLAALRRLQQRRLQAANSP